MELHFLVLLERKMCKLVGMYLHGLIAFCAFCAPELQGDRKRKLSNLPHCFQPFNRKPPFIGLRAANRILVPEETGLFDRPLLGNRFDPFDRHHIFLCFRISIGVDIIAF